MSDQRFSYAQNFEDILLERVFQGQQPGFFVDVGAGDPIRYSVSYKLYLRGWRGLNIEPSPELAAALRRTRPEDITLGIAVGDAPCDLTLHHCEARELSTLDAGVGAGLRRAGYRVDEVVVAVRTLREVLDEHCAGKDIAFLKIDVEGWEGRVLAGADLERHRPRLLIVEATVPRSHEPAHHAWESGLIAKGFTPGWFDGLNRFYVRNEDIGLLERLRLPVNVFDGFSPYDLFARSSALQRAEEGWRRAHARAEELASELLSVRARLVEIEAERRGGWLGRRLRSWRAILQR